MRILNELKDRLINNERMYLRHNPERKQSVNQLISNINKITYPYDLINFVERSFTDPKKKLRFIEYKINNLPTPIDIVNEYKNIESLPRIMVTNLKVGETYPSIMISALANNFNIQVGMYYIEFNNKPYVIVTAEIPEGQDNVAYSNSWIVKNKKIRYMMQQPRNNLNFKNLPYNKAIIDSYENKTNLDVLVFYRSSRTNDFTYAGIFKVTKVNDDNSVQLEIIEENLFTQYIDTEKNLFETKLDKTKKLILENKINKESLKIGKIKKRDYIESYINNLITGEAGETLVLKYEQERLKALGLKGDEYTVQKVSDYDDTMGYDIKSYNIINDKIEEIFIEVKTTTDSSFGRFYLSSNEFKTMKQKKDHYRIYRVFDINSNDPKLFIISNENFDEFNIEASTYIVNQG